MSKKLYIRIPGYQITANIHVPLFDAYSLWQSAYLHSMTNQTKALFDNLPWPQNNDFIKTKLLFSLIDNDYLNFSDDCNLQLKDDIKQYLKNDSSIKDFFFKESIYRGKWWVDAVSGTLIPYKLFNKYEVDTSEHTNKNILGINPNKIYKPYEVEALINADISELMSSVFRGDNYNEIDKAYIEGGFSIEPVINEIEIPITPNKLIPPDLHLLEPLLLSEFPSIFNVKKRLEQSKINWRLSPVENFAETLQYLSLTNDKLDKTKVKKLNNLLENKNEWIAYYNNGIITEPIVGNNTSIQFAALEELAKNTPQGEKLIILSSFFNTKNIKGFINTIKHNLDSEIIILYGHPEDEHETKINKSISNYRKLLKKHLPEHSIRILPTEIRTHEKIIFNTLGEWMLGSWNATSSPDNTIRFETSIKGQSVTFTKKLLLRIKKLIPEDVYNEIEKKLKSRGDKKEKVQAEELYNKLKNETKFLLEKIEQLENYHSVLNNIRKYLYPFVKRARLTIVNEHQTREVLIKQIISAKKNVFIATDSIKESGLDNTLLEEIKKGPWGQKLLFLLWGRNFRKTGEDLPALEAIEYAKEKLNDNLITGYNAPMENHSKFVAIDGNRLFITSENLLNYGGEKNKYEGRETGILVENLFVTRSILGGAFLHKHHIFSNKTGEIYDILFLGNEMYYALKELEDKSIKHDDFNVIKSGIELEIKDNYKQLLNKFLHHQNNLKQTGVVNYMLNPYSPHHIWLPFLEQVEKETIEKIHTKTKTNSHNPNLEKAIELIEKNLVNIPAGKFIMGFNGVKEERPAHKVIISKNFFASKYIMTQEIWQLVMPSLPANITKAQRNPDYPVFFVSYYDVIEFIEKLNNYVGEKLYDLPSEAEWEYMCRAGSTTKYTCGNKVDVLDDYAWSKRNAHGKIQKVGLKKPNKFGLYDIHGLMFEMCKDDQRKYSNKTLIDPVGPTDTKMIVTPGGAWGNTPGLKSVSKDYFRCSARNITEKTLSSYRLSFRLIKRSKKN